MLDCMDYSGNYAGFLCIMLGYRQIAISVILLGIAGYLIDLVM